MIGRLLRSADFERALGAPTVARTTHFALHHAPESIAPAAAELSTDGAPTPAGAVDEVAPHCRAGFIVPKRHARRAVTRNLIRRLARAGLGRRAATLAPGVWVVRLRAPVERQQFPSASSNALRGALDAELAVLLGPRPR